MAAARLPRYAVLNRVAQFLPGRVTKVAATRGRGPPWRSYLIFILTSRLVPLGIDGLYRYLPFVASAESLSWACHAVGQGVGGAAHGRSRAGGEQVQPLTAARADPHAIGKTIP